MSKGNGLFAAARFCPFCGVEALDRDRYAETLQEPRYKTEFVCTACGRGFQIGPSIRHIHAAQLTKDHRAMRPPDRPPKRKPEDPELYALNKFADRLAVPGLIRRTKNGQKFVWEDANGVAHGSAGYQEVMLLLRGYQIAQLSQ